MDISDLIFTATVIPFLSLWLSWNEREVMLSVRDRSEGFGAVGLMIGVFLVEVRSDGGFLSQVNRTELQRFETVCGIVIRSL